MNLSPSAPPVPAPAPARRRIGELLVAAGLINADDLAQALDWQKVHGGKLGAALVALGKLTDEQLTGGLAAQLGLAVCDLETLSPPAEVLSLLPEAMLREHHVLPLAVQGRALVLGMVDSQDQKAAEAVYRHTGFRNIEPRLVTEGSFQRFLDSHFTSPDVVHEIQAALGEAAPVILEKGVPVKDGTAVVRFVEWLLRYAVKLGASDIHLEPFEDFLRIRLRIDGSLRTILTPGTHLAQPLISRIKVLAEMDISERRKPQDGHIELPSATEELHFRVSTLPVVHGEKCVIRLLRKEAHLADLSRLGFTKDQLEIIKSVAAMPQGLLLVTGPTGSGKTTTLHAVLNHINDPDVNIVTIEDPVEQTLHGINHVQVQEKGGVTFASALRSILRQDPDIVFIGEMCDPEVSAIAVKAALTGHLVLSTLHTNGTAETFARLGDMGIPSYLVASSVQLVVAQRLVRRLCTCARPTGIDAALVDRFRIQPEQLRAAVFKEPVGCPRCMNQGYKGRVAIYELVAPSPALREVLRRGGDESAILKTLAEEGMRWMWDAGVSRALAGDTTLEEIARSISPPKG